MPMQQDRAPAAETTPARATPDLPTLPAAGAPADAAADVALLRRFHDGDPTAGEALRKPGSDWLPALLYRYRDPSRVRNDYPLVLTPPDDATADTLVRSLTDVLRETLERVAPGGDMARVLKDNLARVERAVRAQLGDAPDPREAAPLVAAAGQQVEQALALPDAAARGYREDLARLIDELPGGARLLALTEATPLQLMLQAIAFKARNRQAALREAVERLSRQLHDLQRVERARTGGGDGQGGLGATVGETGAARIDAAALANIMSRSAKATPVDDRRGDRIDLALASLKKFLNDPPRGAVIVHGEELPDAWKTGGGEWVGVGTAQVTEAATQYFDRQAVQYTPLIAAMRLARLEIENAYDVARHDSMLASLDWHAFSREELLMLPPVVAVESVAQLAAMGMTELSRLLLSGRPIEVLVTVQPAANPGAAPTDDPLAGFRFELAYLGISHREALVHQTSAARPEHLLRGYLTSLDATQTSLHVIASGLTVEGGDPRIGAWMQASAALEGRAHPFFHYDPLAGETWARRFDFDGNPAQENDWPNYEFAYAAADGEGRTTRIPFTFADYALLEAPFAEHFRVAPAAIAEERFILLAEALTDELGTARERLPFVWATDADGTLQRLIVSRALLIACRDRLRYWRTLQEFAGVRNEHVREAVARERERLAAEFDEQRAALEAEHAAVVEQVRNETAAEAMQKLAAALLETDLSTLAPAGASTASAGAPDAAFAPQSGASAEAPPAEAPPVAEEEVEEQEPWIASALCTSCNDCITLNGMMFKYNANKQAYIADASAGTYAQLVQAAEKCPARCIHPGTPQNPDEPELPALRERAKKFN